MDITFSDKNSININSKNASVAINPAKEPKADFTLYTEPLEQSTTGKYFDGPGEYEVLGCMIDGVAGSSSKTIYSMVIDDMHVVYAVDLSEALSDEQLERIEAVDILILSVENDNYELMNKVVTQLQPRILIPLMQNEGELAKIKAEFGKEVEPTERFKIVKKDLPTDSQQLVILK